MTRNIFRTAQLLLAFLIGVDAFAEEAPFEASHRGVRIIVWPAQADAYYEIELISADQAIGRIREALDLIEEKSPSGAALLDALRKSGYVLIVYDPGFPPAVASDAGTPLAAFVPDLVVGNYADTRRFPIVVSRYIVKRKLEVFAATLVHELVHGVQHKDGRLQILAKVDMECEASLYHERALQDLGVDKRSEQVVGLRRYLQLNTCVPFIRYMQAHRPEKMDLWDTLNPDVPQLLSIFDEYLKVR